MERNIFEAFLSITGVSSKIVAILTLLAQRATIVATVDRGLPLSSVYIFAFVVQLFNSLFLLLSFSESRRVPLSFDTKYGVASLRLNSFRAQTKWHKIFLKKKKILAR